MLLWWLSRKRELRREVQQTIAASETWVAVSAATAWEIAIKRAAGLLRAPNDLPRQLDRHHFEPLPITVEHALAAGALPPEHDDPFDRMLVAQAQLEGLTIVTRDPQIARYSVPILPA